MRIILFIVTFLLLSSNAFALYSGSSPNIPLFGIQLDWGGNAATGDYTLAPGLTNYVVDQPNGNTPSISDLPSLQYHNHMKIGFDPNGRQWVAYSGGQRLEDEGGEFTEVNSTTNNWTTSTGPIEVFPPQSPFNGTQAAGNRVVRPRAFVTYQGNFYLVSGVDQITLNGTGGTSRGFLGLALLAAKCNSDGTVGSPFLISTATYTPYSGSFPTYTYDPVLGPPLFTIANIFGLGSGSDINQAPSAWINFTQGPNGVVYAEPSTIAITTDGQSLYRVWRNLNTTYGADVNMAYQYSLNYGSDWSVIRTTTVVNEACTIAVIKLANGHIAIVGNPKDKAGVVSSRDPLYVATFNATTGAIIHLYAILQDEYGPFPYDNGVCNYGNGYLYCGASGPVLAEKGGLLYVSYSINKQIIGVTTIPSGSL